MKPRILLVASKTGYQVREFYAAAERLDFELVLATDRCHILDDPWADRATPVDFDAPEAGIELLRARGPFAGILAVGDKPAGVAAQAAERLGLRFHPLQAVRAAGDKFLTREHFRRAGLRVPAYRLIQPGECAAGVQYPCVLKPLHLSASRGVIRANDPQEFERARARIGRIAGEAPVLVEDFIPGREFAVEAVVTGGRLQTLAVFDKPDPLDGPFFEETLYVAPSRAPHTIQQSITQAAQQAVTALGLTDGPAHAEMRVNSEGIWMLEVAPRPIGGLCARALLLAGVAAGEITLEELLLRHASGEDVSTAKLAEGAHGVMMIPIPQSGIYFGVEGVPQASSTPDIKAVEITAKAGQKLEVLPEGASYLGFLFARAGTPEQVEHALRQAHSCLEFRISEALPVVK